MKTLSRNTLLLCLLIAPLAQGAAADAPASGEPPSDQVVVQGTMTNVTKLAEEVRQAEYRFYERYNELNTKRDFDIKCYNEAPIGSRLKRKACKPVFQSLAEESESRAFLLSLQHGLGGDLTLANITVGAQRPAYQKNIVDVTRKSPDLVKLLDEHAEAIFVVPAGQTSLRIVASAPPSISHLAPFT